MTTREHIPAWQFRIFYDGDCPLCMREMRAMMRRPCAAQLDFVNTAKPEFDPAEFGISSDPNRLIHGMLPDGTIVQGMEVFRNAYSVLGLGWLIAPTGWPFLKPVFDFAYAVFARHRMRISKMLGRHCSDSTCQ